MSFNGSRSSVLAELEAVFDSDDDILLNLG
jgi:hypothetical protein